MFLSFLIVLRKVHVNCLRIKTCVCNRTGLQTLPKKSQHTRKPRPPQDFLLHVRYSKYTKRYKLIRTYTYSIYILQPRISNIIIIILKILILESKQKVGINIFFDVIVQGSRQAGLCEFRLNDRLDVRFAHLLVTSNNIPQRVTSEVSFQHPASYQQGIIL